MICQLKALLISNRCIQGFMDWTLCSAFVKGMYIEGWTLYFSVMSICILALIMLVAAEVCMWPHLEKSTMWAQFTPSYIFTNIFHSKCTIPFPLATEESPSNSAVVIRFCRGSYDRADRKLVTFHTQMVNFHRPSHTLYYRCYDLVIFPYRLVRSSGRVWWLDRCLWISELSDTVTHTLTSHIITYTHSQPSLQLIINAL